MATFRDDGTTVTYARLARRSVNALADQVRAQQQDLGHLERLVALVRHGNVLEAKRLATRLGPYVVERQHVVASALMEVAGAEDDVRVAEGQEALAQLTSAPGGGSPRPN